MPDVVLRECQRYEPAAVRQALAEVLEPLGLLKAVHPGMTVGIKANLVSARKPEDAVTTHPVALCALTELLRDCGAKVIVGDSPGGLYTPAFVGHVYSACGLHEVEAHGGLLNRNFSQKTAYFPQASVAKKFEYTAWLDETDLLVDFCKLKTHGMMAMSCAAKNMFGVIPGTVKPEYHFLYPDPRDFARMIVDLNEYFRPAVSIVDGVIGMEGNGPTQGTPRSVGCFGASASPHRLDLVCAELIGLRRSEVPTLEAALERGLIPPDWQDLEISGDVDRWRQADFEKLDTLNSTLFQSDRDLRRHLTGKFIQAAVRQKPKVQPRECVGCGECARICPAKAIVMAGGRPKIDRGACIRCFCCQEFCPKGAMKVVRPPIARMLNHHD